MARHHPPERTVIADGGDRGDAQSSALYGHRAANADVGRYVPAAAARFAQVGRSVHVVQVVKRTGQCAGCHVRASKLDQLMVLSDIIVI